MIYTDYPKHHSTVLTVFNMLITLTDLRKYKTVQEKSTVFCFGVFITEPCNRTKPSNKSPITKGTQISLKRKKHGFANLSKSPCLVNFDNLYTAQLLSCLEVIPLPLSTTATAGFP